MPKWTKDLDQSYLNDAVFKVAKKILLWCDWNQGCEYNIWIIFTSCKLQERGLHDSAVELYV